MGARRTDMHRLQEMVRLHRMGASSREIARQLRTGRDTIRCYLRGLRRADRLEQRSEARAWLTPRHVNLQHAVLGAVHPGHPLDEDRLESGRCPDAASGDPACRAAGRQLRTAGTRPRLSRLHLHGHRFQLRVELDVGHCPRAVSPRIVA